MQSKLSPNVEARLRRMIRERERQLRERVADPLSFRAIAVECGVSTRTVGRFITIYQTSEKIGATRR